MTDALTGKLLAERYQLFERLDDTATTRTYRGQDRQLGSACRVVVPKPSARASFDSFERTWRQLAELRSPHLASMTAQDRLSGGRPFVVFRWIEGRTLDQIIDAEGALSSARALTICRAVLLALKVAHDRAIVHRDVTLRNVVIGHGPDAGAIKLVGFAGAPRDAVDARAVPGDPTALAPERFADPRVATPLSDLYAVGVLLYTMLAGRPPFEPEEPSDAEPAFERLAWLHTHAQPARPNTGVPEGTWRLTLSLLEKRSHDRPAHADAALSALNADHHSSTPLPFAPRSGATSDPFESLVSARGSLDALAADRSDPFALADEATVADGGYDDDDEPTVQQTAPALSYAAQMLFSKPKASKHGVDLFARTRAVEDGPVTQADRAGSHGPDSPADSADLADSDESSMDRLNALIDADPLAIEAEHDSLSDIADELTLPGQSSHLRAMITPGAAVPERGPLAFADAPIDDLLTRPLHPGASIPEAPLDDLRPRPPAAPPGMPVSPAPLAGRRIGNGIKTRAARPTGKIERATPTSRPSDALARLPNVSTFADPASDEVSTIAAPDRRRPSAPKRPLADARTPAAEPDMPAPPKRDVYPPTDQQHTLTRPLNMPDANPTQRLVGLAIAVAALLAIISALMWFTSDSAPPTDAPPPDASPASQAPVRQSIGE
ncbi:MAG: serine/threonine protein kinase [Bradymonadia bacterium]